MKEFEADDTAEPDHPLWKRFKTIAGNDAPARKLFAELIADPRRLKLLDDADRDPEKVGDLYETRGERLLRERGEAGPVGRDSRTAQKRPWADELAILYLGTYPASAAKFPATTFRATGSKSTCSGRGTRR